jgi:alginate O-acetyltransferase complex protein AlgI
MLFNSAVFILYFLPAMLVAFYLAAALLGQTSAILVLFAGSVFFYGWWDASYVPLFLGSLAFNFLLGQHIRASDHAVRRRWLVAGGILANLALLAYFKYAGFLVKTASFLTALPLPVPEIVLPLAISFFTFQQIAYLVDAGRGLTGNTSFLHYVAFVSFFPHLIAGPILHHREMLSQLRAAVAARFNPGRFQAGLLLFAIGLCKKIAVADTVAPIADRTFARAAEGVQLGLMEAWGGALAFAEQIYFDFSGYSDMAIGIALMLGFVLPLNFNSPYKATSIIDFWRRWHITLSRFLRDYLYIALGGNRRGVIRRYVNLLATMTIGGLWHGAGWTFALWGAGHGLLLAINHASRHLLDRLGWHPQALAWRLAGGVLTFLLVTMLWVLFRATSMQAVGSFYAGMLGLNGLPIDPSWQPFYAVAKSMLPTLELPATEEVLFPRRSALIVLLILLPVLLLPNSQTILAAAHAGASGTSSTIGTVRQQAGTTYPLAATTDAGAAGIAWWPRAWHGVMLGVLAFLALKLAIAAPPSSFIYFQF